MVRLKIYGTIKGERRIKVKHKYYAIRRNKDGTFKTRRKWNRKQPLKKSEYKEKILEAKTYEELEKLMDKYVKENHWDEYAVKTP